MTLELLTEKYKAQIQELANDAQVSATSSVEFPCTLEMIQEWIDQNRQSPPKERYFVILHEGQPVGGCALKYINPETRSAYLGYWVGRRFWGQGLAFQAAQMLRDIAFTSLELELLHAMCLRSSNAASLRVLLKIGFVPDHSREAHPTMGRWAEHFPDDAWGYYVLTRESWLSLRA